MIYASDLVAKFQYALDNKWGYIYGTAGQLWTQAKQDATTREMAVKYGQKWVGRRVADCSGLFTWAFKELGGYMYHGSNTMFKKYCVATGELKNGVRTDGEKLKPGTAVFTGTREDHGHVGIYIGDGDFIHASSGGGKVMISSFLSGLMIGDIKGYIAERAPWLNNINPASVISDSIHCLNIYSDYRRYTTKMVTMLIMIAVFSVIGLIFTRRKKYASI